MLHEFIVAKHTGMRILIIEDDNETATYLGRALREAGHMTEHGADGESGAAMAAGGGYDVIVADRMLPKRDGLSVIEELRKRGDHTPVLVLSALGQVDDRVTGLRAGGDDYLAKPYAFSELLARVEALAAHGIDVNALEFEGSYGRTTLEYYDGFVFGFYAEGRPDLPPVATGGRYDALTRQLGQGRAIPAVGGVIRPELALAIAEGRK